MCGHTRLSYIINLSQIQTARVCMTLDFIRLSQQALLADSRWSGIYKSHLVRIFKERGYSINLLKKMFPEGNIKTVQILFHHLHQTL
jgi:hypothetical protein